MSICLKTITQKYLRVLTPQGVKALNLVSMQKIVASTWSANSAENSAPPTKGWNCAGVVGAGEGVAVTRVSNMMSPGGREKPPPTFAVTKFEDFDDRGHIVPRGEFQSEFYLFGREINVATLDK